MLSVIIVNYKSEKYLEACLASLKDKFLNVEHEIIVVNNDMDLKTEKPLEVIWVEAGRNLGFGSACNLGAQKAKGEFVFFLNPDAKIISDNAKELLKIFENNKKIVIIGPRLITEKGNVQPWSAGKEFSFWRLFKNNLGMAESKKIWKSSKEVLADWVSGAAMFVRKEIFDKIGGFDGDFFMYFEDEDFCQRTRREGYEILYYPHFIVSHMMGKSRKNFLKQKTQFFKSMLLYIRKRRKK